MSTSAQTISIITKENNFIGYSLLEKDYNDACKCIGYFLIELFHKNYFGYDGLIEKQKLRYEFHQYMKRNDLLMNPKFGERVGTLLRQNGFLMHTERGSDQFKIRNVRFRDFYNQLLEEMDEMQINVSTSQIMPKMLLSRLKSQENLEIDVNDDEQELEYQRGTETLIIPDFRLTSTGCFICQENFLSEEQFTAHIEDHGESSEFKSISNYPLTTKKVFRLTYRTCKDNHLLRFTIKTNEKDIIIEKIVIVRAKWMNYARNEDVPFQVSSSGVEHFFVDGHLFNIGIPQPIVIIYRHKKQELTRNIAQYLFMRQEDFPRVNMKLRSTRVISRDEMKKLRKLSDFNPPPEVEQLSHNGFDVDDIAIICPNIRQYLDENKELRSSNIVDILELLLQIEDVETNNKYKRLNRKQVEIKGYCGEYSVTIKDAPFDTVEILNPFDEIHLSLGNGDNDENDSNNQNWRDRSANSNGKNKKNKKIFCYVYRVYGSKVCFKPFEFSREKIDMYKKYNISFKPGRHPIRYQYRALELLNKRSNLQKYLFPTINFNKTPSELNLEYYNKEIEINPEQMQAVKNITDDINHGVPYVIFGPPGTGKTTTVVESIYQLWKKDKNHRILVTAGSNAACDEVGRKLCNIFNKVDPEGLNLIRIYAAAVEKRIDNMDNDLLEASNLCHSYHFYPSIDSICSYRIIVATLSVVGKLVHAKLSEKFFTHVFIDECAASTETESLIGIAGVLSSKSKLILSGDPKQLGPILKSTKASELGLSQSLMERLLKRKLYEVDPNTNEYDRSIQTRLIRNFRTHSDILHLSNMLYYQSELICCAKREITHWAIGWHRLPRKDFPIVFNVVYGHTNKDAESTSLCNYKELRVTLDYVKNLMFYGINGRKISESDIGIISPYRKQCNLIRDELDKRRWYKIETGSVETFQGKEKPIIIISMVRSNTSTIGFLDNPKRLNVTLTRAQALMIIIGNPETLEKFDDWKYVIEYCKENRALTGAKYPREEQINIQASLQSIKNYGSEFKTSQSSLSTISISQSLPQQQRQQNSGNKRNNYRRRYGRSGSGSGKNCPSGKVENFDSISICSSNIEEKVPNWLEETVKFLEKYSINDNSKSTIEATNKEVKGVQEPPNNNSQFQKEVVDMISFATSDLKSQSIKTAASSISTKLTKVREETSNSSSENQTTTSLKKSSEETDKMIPARKILPQQTVKPSSIVHPLSFTSSNFQEVNSSRTFITPSAPSRTLHPSTSTNTGSTTSGSKATVGTLRLSTNTGSTTSGSKTTVGTLYPSLHNGSITSTNTTTVGMSSTSNLPQYKNTSSKNDGSTISGNKTIVGASSSVSSHSQYAYPSSSASNYGHLTGQSFRAYPITIHSPLSESTSENKTKKDSKRCTIS